MCYTHLVFYSAVHVKLKMILYVHFEGVQVKTCTMGTKHTNKQIIELTEVTMPFFSLSVDKPEIKPGGHELHYILYYIILYIIT